MDQKQFEAQLTDAETRLRRLKMLYEQWFAGFERVEPAVARKEVDDMLQRLRREQVRNTGLRFRLQQLVQRHTTFTTYWRRIARQIEEGTYQRDVLKAKKLRDQSLRELEPEVSYGMDVDVDVDLDMNTALEEAQAAVEKQATLASVVAKAPPLLVPPPIAAPAALAAPPPAAAGGGVNAPIAPPPPAAAGAAPKPPAAPDGKKPPAVPPSVIGTAKLPGPPRPPPSPRAISPFAMPLPPTPGAARPPAVPGAPAVPAAPAPAAGAAAAAAAPAPRATQPMAAMPRPAPAAAPTAAASQNGGNNLSQNDLQRIYDRYLQARKQNAERTDNVKIESIEKSLRGMLPSLEKKHAGKKIDFEVVVKDGKVALKPVAK